MYVVRWQQRSRVAVGGLSVATGHISLGGKLASLAVSMASRTERTLPCPPTVDAAASGRRHGLRGAWAPSCSRVTAERQQRRSKRSERLVMLTEKKSPAGVCVRFFFPLLVTNHLLSKTPKHELTGIRGESVFKIKVLLNVWTSATSWKADVIKQKEPLLVLRLWWWRRHTCTEVRDDL